MFVLPTFSFGVVASPTITSVFDISLTFPTIQVFDNESDFRDETDAPDYTIVHAKDTDRLYVYNGTVWHGYNQN
jgi:hypothetical protein